MKQFFLLLFITVGGHISFGQSVVLDDQFSNDGKVFINAKGIGYLSEIFSLSNGKILLTGITSNAEAPILIRLNKDGKRDKTFGRKGRLIVELEEEMTFYGNWAVQPDGKMILATIVVDSLEESSVVLLRYLSDGNLDDQFGESGKMTIKISGPTNGINDLVLQPDGKIVFISSIKDGRYKDVLLIRAFPDGTIDSDFGNNGISIIEVKGEVVEVLHGVLQPDGKLLVMAKSTKTYAREYFLIRCHQDGSFDSELGEKGIFIPIVDDTFGTPKTIFLPKEKKILVYGTFCQSEHQNPCSTIQKYTLDGRLDSTYHYDGILEQKAIDNTLSPRKAVRLPNGEVVFSGNFKRRIDGLSYTGFGMAKYSPNRVIDVAFAKHGILRTEFSDKSSFLYDAVAQSNGTIIAVGSHLIVPPSGNKLIKLPKRPKIPVVRYRLLK